MLCDYGCGQIAIYKLKGKFCCSKSYNSCIAIRKRKHISNPNRKTQEQVISEFKDVWGERFDYNKVQYVNSSAKVIIICKEHGEFSLMPHRHKSGTGCYKCGRKSATTKTKEKLKIPLIAFIRELQLIYGNKYDYSKIEYEQSHKEIILSCFIHGDFKTSRKKLLEHFSGCPLCQKHGVSRLETAWLDSLNLPADQQHRSVNLKINNKRCVVDGFDPKTNTVYEFHGDFWHGNPKIYSPDDIHPIKNQPFGKIYQKSVLKDQSIIKAGYNLITMWESDLNAHPSFAFIS